MDKITGQSQVLDFYGNVVITKSADLTGGSLRILKGMDEFDEGGFIPTQEINIHKTSVEILRDTLNKWYPIVELEPTEPEPLDLGTVPLDALIAEIGKRDGILLDEVHVPDDQHTFKDISIYSPNIGVSSRLGIVIFVQDEDHEDRDTSRAWEVVEDTLGIKEGDI